MDGLGEWIQGMCPEWMVWDDGFRACALNGWSGMMDSGQVP